MIDDGSGNPPETAISKDSHGFIQDTPLPMTGLFWTIVTMVLKAFGPRILDRWNRLGDFRTKIDGMRAAIKNGYSTHSPTGPAIKAWRSFEADCQEIRKDIKQKNKAEFDRIYREILDALKTTHKPKMVRNDGCSVSADYSHIRGPLLEDLDALENVTRTNRGR